MFVHEGITLQKSILVNYYNSKLVIKMSKGNPARVFYLNVKKRRREVKLFISLLQKVTEIL